MIYTFCLYHFSLKCMIKNLYLFSDDPLNITFDTKYPTPPPSGGIATSQLNVASPAGSGGGRRVSPPPKTNIINKTPFPPGSGGTSQLGVCLCWVGGVGRSQSTNINITTKIATATINSNNGLATYNWHKLIAQHQKNNLTNWHCSVFSLSLYFFIFSLPFYLIDSRSPTVVFYPH